MNWPVAFLLLAPLLTTALAASANTGPQPTLGSADLLQLYRESRLEDPRVLAAHARARSAQAREREAFGGLLPQLSASGSVNRSGRDDEVTRDYYGNERYALTLSQHLYNKAAWEHFRRFKHLARQGEFEAQDAQADATVDLARRYFVALAADDELELVQAEQRATRKNLDRVDALYRRKLAVVTDVLNLRARADALAARELEARNQVQLSREALSEIVGRPVAERLSRLREDLQVQVPGDSMQAWTERALAANPALKAQSAALAAADAALREGRGGHYPSLSLSLSAQRSDVGYDNTPAPRSDTYVASVGVAVPIYSGGSTSARVRALQSDRLVSEQELEAIRRQVVKETTSAYLTAQASVQRIHAARQALGSAEQSSVAAERGFKFGVVNAVDVLTSVQNEYAARRDLLKAQYDFIIALLVLNRWAGGVSEDNLGQVNQWLTHSDQARALERRAAE